jgi:hypothetical protein
VTVVMPRTNGAGDDRSCAPSRPGLALAVVLVAVALGAAAGCGKKGPPRPPEPRGPLPPRKVQARQLGGAALVSFEVPPPRGERPAQQPVTAELVRVTWAAGTAAQSDPEAFRRRGQLIGSVEGDPLERDAALRIRDDGLAALANAGEGATVRYAVRVRDRRRRSSPLVVAQDLVLLAVAEPPRRVRAEPTADGIRLTWDAPVGEGPFRYNVYRSPSGEPPPLTPANSAPLSSSEFLDPQAVPGREYDYTVRVALAEGRPYREGLGSEPVTVLSVDRFAPGAPTGLVAVQEGEAVRLFWNPSPERDLAGYRVYRRVADGELEAVGPDLVGQPLFLDTTVEPGQQVTYRVSAVDRAEIPNESELSAPFDLVVAEEPVQPGGAR